MTTLKEFSLGALTVHVAESRITMCPGTAVRLHPRCALYLDPDAFGGEYDFCNGVIDRP
jgi:hypothetical protein